MYILDMSIGLLPGSQSTRGLMEGRKGIYSQSSDRLVFTKLFLYHYQGTHLHEEEAVSILMCEPLIYLDSESDVSHARHSHSETGKKDRKTVFCRVLPTFFFFLLVASSFLPVSSSSLMP